MRVVRRRIVSAIVKSVDEMILFGYRDPSKGGVWPGTWHIPGGGREDGEDDTDALRRELFEETGLDVPVEALRLIDSGGRGTAAKQLASGEWVECEMVFIVYLVKLSARACDIKLKPGDEFSELCWYDVHAIKALEIPPPGAELFRKLGYL